MLCSVTVTVVGLVVMGITVACGLIPTFPLVLRLVRSVCIYNFFHRLSVVGLRPSSSLFTGCAVPLRGDWAIFCHVGSRRVGGVWSAREKSLGIPHRGWELNPGRREDRQWAIPLSYHDWVATMLQLYHHFKIVKGHNHSRSSQYQLQICESSLFIICSLNHSSSEGT